MEKGYVFCRSCRNPAAKVMNVYIGCAGAEELNIKKREEEAGIKKILLSHVNRISRACKSKYPR